MNEAKNEAESKTVQIRDQDWNFCSLINETDTKTTQLKVIQYQKIILDYLRQLYHNLICETKF